MRAAAFAEDGKTGGGAGTKTNGTVDLLPLSEGVMKGSIRLHSLQKSER
jgi:hypothetical protein